MSALPSPDRPEAPLFSDGIGERVVSADGATGELVQVLRINPALTAVPSFEFALRERVARLANFRHGYYARVRRVDRAQAHALSIVSDHVEGTRLSEILRVAGERGLQLDINAALCLIRQLVPAVALLHENARDVAHGLISPERLIVTPHARLVIAEHVMGAAVEQMQYGRERLWSEFRVVMPPSAGMARFDQRADVAGVGVVALSLVLGRPLTTDEFPRRLNELLDEARERTALGEEQPLSPPLRAWIARALQVDVRRAFGSASEALSALEQLGAEGAEYVAAPVALETFLSRYITALLSPPSAPQPKPAPAPVVVAPNAPTAPVAAQPAPVVAPPAPVRPIVAPPAPVAAPAAIVPPTPVAPAVPVAPPVPVAPMVAPAAAEPVAAVQEAGPVHSIAHDLQDLLNVNELDLAFAQKNPEEPLFNPDKPFGTPEAVASPAVYGADDPGPAAAAAAPTSGGKGSGRKWLAVAAALIVVATGGFAGLKVFAGNSAPPAMATLAVQSNPPGVAVFIDGVNRGMTPARVTLAAGAHILELRGRGVPRVIPVTLTAGAEVSQYLEIAEAPLPEQALTVPAAGTDPAPQAPTSTDVTPVTTDAAAAPAGAPLAGWISLKMPFAMEIREAGRLLGTSDADRLMLAAGRHDLEFSNATLAYTVTRAVNVVAGKVTPITLELPQSTVNLNAAPWAEVWIDGQRVGETPIGNLAVTIGAHEIVFRHPQFGEKRHAISVTAGAPVRLSIDMKQ
jgi:hypothetical protein